MVHFKKDILKILVPLKYDVRTLIPHKKRGRLKTVLGILISIPIVSVGEINIYKISVNESEFSDSNIALDEFDV